MHSWTSYFCVISIFIFINHTCYISSSERNLDYKNFCIKHLKIPDHCEKIKNSLSLIPTMSAKLCDHVECPVCQTMWYEQPAMEDFDSEDEDAPLEVLMCECKHQASKKYHGKRYIRFRYSNTWLRQWKSCTDSAIYQAYFCPLRKSSFYMFEKYLKYANDIQNCSCYWPELNRDAERINDIAFRMFLELLEGTDLSEIGSNQKKQQSFLDHNITDTFLTEKGTALSFVCHSFFFTHYYQVAAKIRNYAAKQFSFESYQQIDDKLDIILSTLATQFHRLYNTCLKKHPNSYIQAEKQFIELLFLTSDMSTNIVKNEVIQSLRKKAIKSRSNKQIRNKRGIYLSNNALKKRRKPLRKELPQEKLGLITKNNILNSEVYLLHGTGLNESHLFNDAICILNKSLDLNSNNVEAYIERAFAYFELGKFEQALDDYFKAKELLKNRQNQHIFHFYIPKSQTNNSENTFLAVCNPEFAKGFALGSLDGMKIGADEFVPSLLNSFRGIGSGLWAFAQEPEDTSRELIYCCLATLEFLYKKSNKEICEELVPELKELFLSWKDITDSEKGQKVGYILGKYGVDFFAFTGGIKAVKLYRNLRRANTMYTLETCATSIKNQKIILEEAAKRYALREEAVFKANLKIHWDKQNKHIPGSHNYEIGKSIITVTRSDLEHEIYTHIGKGQKVVGDSLFSPGYKERVQFSKTIGEYVEFMEDGTLKKTPSNKGIIIYSKTGIHMYPTDPEAIIKLEIIK